MNIKTALIFGVTGQDGSYLAEYLLKKKYVVHGVIRRSSSFNTSRIDHLYQDPNTKKKFYFTLWRCYRSYFSFINHKKLNQMKFII